MNTLTTAWKLKNHCKLSTFLFATMLNITIMKLQTIWILNVSKQKYKNIEIFLLKKYFSLLSDVSYFLLLKFFVCKETFHEYNIFRSSRDYKVKMLGIIFLCEGQNSTCSHWQQCVYLSRSSHWFWACCTIKLFSTCGVKILEKYLWRCTFFSKVACWRWQHY